METRWLIERSVDFSSSPVYVGGRKPKAEAFADGVALLCGWKIVEHGFERSSGEVN